MCYNLGKNNIFKHQNLNYNYQGTLYYENTPKVKKTSNIVETVI